MLREELHFLLAGGAALVQLDEPVLSELVFETGGLMTPGPLTPPRGSVRIGGAWG